jgi:transposase
VKPTELFTAALGLQAPWGVEDIRFEPDQGAIHFDLACESKHLACPVCGLGEQPIHDRLERTWQHLHFFQYRAYLHAQVPRVACGGCGKVTQVPVPWARAGSGFTLLMDALIVTLAQKLPVRQIAALLKVSDKRVWQALNAQVEAARARESYAEVERLGVDEKHVGRLGYFTLFHDAVRRRVLFGTPGREAKTFEAFRDDFEAHGGQVERVKAIAMDLSKAYQAGARAVFPKADRCFDAFHVAKLIHEALDAVRRAEVKGVPELKGVRWGTLKAPATWTMKQLNDMHWLQRSGLKTARAWRMKERWGEIHHLARQGHAPEPLIRAWISWARRSRLEPFKKLGATLRDHLDGILNAYTQNLSNAAAESLNSLVQAAIVRARGFRTPRNLMNIIYLTAGKLTHLPASPFAPAHA